MIRPLLLAFLCAAPAAAQDTAPVRVADSAPAVHRPLRDRYPFGVGERFSYQVKLGIFSVGRASMEVMSLDSIRGHETFQLRFVLNGRALFFTLDDTLSSWTSTESFLTYRFNQHNNEDGKIRNREYLMWPDSGYYRRVGRRPDTTYDSVHEPLDDVAFFYWVRTLPLEVGKSYTWDRYFIPDRNPVRIRVLKRQDCELPHDVKRRCLLIQPTIKSTGMLSESSDARILLTDDIQRIPVEVKTNFSFGTLTLKLRDVDFAPGSPFVPAVE
ncbi:MAG TPA: DUF3108 domain-containing protein [Gemmatimonadales bacterium]|nr:DUF3108 domain-containing protein [Gemmatimonadales bacterium]